MIEIELNWEDFKSNVSNRSLDHYYYMTGSAYNLIAIENAMAYKHKLDIDDVAEYETGLKLTANTKATTPKTSTVKPQGNATSYTSHNWCDKCTWYEDSMKVTGEVVPTNDNLTYTSANDCWIDLTNGRVFKEDDIASSCPVNIYVDAIEVTSGFTINYESGSVTFDITQTGIITVDYHYATTSTYTIIPDSGTMLTISDAEVQFSKDIAFDSTINFEVWVFNPYYGITGHPYEFLVKIPYQSTKYKNIKNVIDSCNQGQGFIPAMPNSGLMNDVCVFPFNYKSVKELRSSQGAELKISLAGDVPLSGEYATATFYLEQEVEE